MAGGGGVSSIDVVASVTRQNTSQVFTQTLSAYKQSKSSTSSYKQSKSINSSTSVNNNIFARFTNILFDKLQAW